MRRGSLRSRTTASAPYCYTYLYLASRRCRYSLIGPRRAPDPPAKERLYEKRILAGQRRVCVDTWTNRLVLRLSLQSGSDPLKSGPAKAGPAGPATPPLNIYI